MVEYLKFKNKQKFDLIILAHTLEHFVDIKKFFKYY